MRPQTPFIGILLGLGLGSACASAPPPTPAPSWVVCGFAVDAERAALRVRGVFAGLPGEVARRTAAPGTEDGFVFEHAAREVTVSVAPKDGGERLEWTALFRARTDVRLVRAGARLCVLIRTVVDGPSSLAAIRQDVRAGVARPMLARLEHEMRSHW